MRQLRGVANRGRKTWWQAFDASEVMNPNTLTMQVLGFTADDLRHDLEEALDLIRRSIPIFGRKRIDREVLDPKLNAGVQNRSDIVGTGSVPEKAR
jgi:hypothetical protein